MDQTIPTTTQTNTAGRTKFIVGGLLIVAAIIYLIVSSTQASAQYFLTVEELLTKGDSVAGRNLRISGAVIGDSIQYDPQTLTLTFTIAHVPGDNKEIEAQGGMASSMPKNFCSNAQPNTKRRCPVRWKDKPAAEDHQG
jgi:cytochrome c-type biogenesis protein CcmE